MKVQLTAFDNLRSSYHTDLRAVLREKVNHVINTGRHLDVEESERTALRDVADLEAPELYGHRILIAGDWHLSHEAAIMAFDLAVRRGADVIFQVGDFGVWPGTHGQEFLNVVEALATDTGIDLAWVDGNHEDFTQIYRYPVAASGWRPIRRGVYHAPRGHVWDWQGTRFAAMGGATSLNRPDLIPGASWWAEEEITSGDLYRFQDNLDAPVDVLFTHDTLSTAVMPFGHHNTFSAKELDRAEKHRFMLDAAAEMAQPELIMHGHFHTSVQQDVTLDSGKTTTIVGLDKETATGAFMLMDLPVQ